MTTPEQSFQYTERMNQALRFINTTGRHLFLTGKAGTGKTTFLKSLPLRTYKQMIIVAPTGIAALNASGTTIHSQFLLPFGMFIPDRAYAEPPAEGAQWYTESVLARRHPLNSQRKQVLRTIDLLIIDEVSMLRADLLDAIDYRLRAARNNYTQSFGGVQLLLIGDLYQLPPVVKKEEESRLRQYYRNAWFFESRALQRDGFTYVELDKIFRQKDATFIDLLNNLRQNRTTQQDIHTLNRFYRPPEEIQALREVITLTTHNYRADEMNRRALEVLPGTSHYFNAIIEDDFPESMYPVLARIELKMGAQIMFTRNDSEGGMYYNGKLATVTNIAGSSITVLLAGSDKHYTLQRVVWENKKYRINNDTEELEDEVAGTFSQYPVKLAWAITVHKSQGLTFEKAIIDVGSAFADGQVYVALSRLRSIDGLILRTRIDPAVVSTDRLIVSFDEYHNKPDALEQEIAKQQKSFLLAQTNTTFDFEPLMRELRYLLKNEAGDDVLDEKNMTTILTQIRDAVVAESPNTVRFRSQLQDLLESDRLEDFLDRVSKGMAYYKALLLEQRKLLNRHIGIARAAKRGKRYLNDLDDLDQLIGRHWERLNKIHVVASGILQHKGSFDLTSAQAESRQTREVIAAQVTQRPPAKKKKKPKEKGKDADEPSTIDITLALMAERLTIAEIAEKRGLARSTIEGHLATAVEKGRIMIDAVVEQEAVEEITAAIAEMEEGFSLSMLRSKLGDRFGYGQLRAVKAMLVNRNNLP